MRKVAAILCASVLIMVQFSLLSMI